MFLRQLTIIIFLIFGCKSTQIDPSTAKTTQQEPVEVEVYDVLTLDETADTSIVDYFHPIKDYRASRSRTFDLLHTKLELRFDWENQHVIGKATLKLKPYFYPRDNTPGCTPESIDFSERLTEFQALGVQIVGVSKDSLKSHAYFKTKKDLTVVLASDEHADACEQFGVWVENNMYGKKYMGIERSTFLVLSDGSIGAVWRKVKVKGHAEAVLETTREILNT